MTNLQDLASWLFLKTYRSLFRQADSRRYAELVRLERAPQSVLEEHQKKRLFTLTYHALRTPYFRRLATMNADSLKITPDTLKHIPVLTKALLQENLSDLLDPFIPKSERIKSQSGGSTGTPTIFYHDAGHWQDFYAAYWLGYAWCGYRPGDRQTFLWGADADAPGEGGIAGLKQYLNNNMFENAFHMTPEGLRRYVQRLQRWQPPFLWSYVSSAVRLAQFVRDENLPLRFKSVRTTAETLTPAQRELIESTFQCKVFNQYGCRELGTVAQECEAHQGLHVFSPNHIVEILPIEGAAYGRVVVTCLTNGVLPFIRYETGDLARWASGDCPCGRTWPRLQDVQGRISDIIVSPSGKWIHGEFFTHLFYKTDNVQQFQVIQDRPDHLRIHIVLTPNAPGGTMESLSQLLKEAIHQHGDPAFQISVEQSKHLETLPSGKFRFTANLTRGPHAA